MDDIEQYRVTVECLVVTLNLVNLKVDKIIASNFHAAKLAPILNPIPKIKMTR